MDASIGGDAVHRRLADTDVGDLARLAHGIARKESDLLAAGCRPGRIGEVGHSVSTGQALSQPVDDRRVVLVNALNRDTVDIGTHGCGDALAPGHMVCGSYLAPVDGAQDDGSLAVIFEDDPLGVEGIGDVLRREDPTAAQRMAEGGGDDGPENRKPHGGTPS